MTPVSNHLYRHIVHQENTFHRSLVLIFTTLMETRHGVIEMSRMRETGIVSGLNIIKLRFRMRDSG